MIKLEPILNSRRQSIGQTLVICTDCGAGNVTLDQLVRIEADAHRAVCPVTTHPEGNE